MTKRRRTIIVLGACGITVGGIAFTFCRFFFFGFPAEVHDSNFVSPDGVYTATLHNVDTGAAGSYCQALLRRTDDSSKSIVLVDGGYEFVDKVEWSGENILTVTTGLEGKPNPSWPKLWQGVKIKYTW